MLTDKTCTYPFEVGVELSSSAEVCDLIITVHSSLVPSRIELYVGVETSSIAPTYANALFRRLGHVSFRQRGESSETTTPGRETRTVPDLNARCRYVKLLVHEPLISPNFNPDHQVCILDVTFMGCDALTKLEHPRSETVFDHRLLVAETLSRLDASNRSAGTTGSSALPPSVYALQYRSSCNFSAGEVALLEAGVSADIISSVVSSVSRPPPSPPSSPYTHRNLYSPMTSARLRRLRHLQDLASSSRRYVDAKRFKALGDELLALAEAKAEFGRLEDMAVARDDFSEAKEWSEKRDEYENEMDVFGLRNDNFLDEDEGVISFEDGGGQDPQAKEVKEVQEEQEEEKKRDDDGKTAAEKQAPAMTDDELRAALLQYVRADAVFTDFGKKKGEEVREDDDGSPLAAITRQGLTRFKGTLAGALREYAIEFITAPSPSEVPEAAAVDSSLPSDRLSLVLYALSYYPPIGLSLVSACVCPPPPYPQDHSSLICSLTCATSLVSAFGSVPSSSLSPPLLSALLLAGIRHPNHNAQDAAARLGYSMLRREVKTRADLSVMCEDEAARDSGGAEKLKGACERFVADRAEEEREMKERELRREIEAFDAEVKLQPLETKSPRGKELFKFVGELILRSLSAERLIKKVFVKDENVAPEVAPELTSAKQPPGESENIPEGADAAEESEVARLKREKKERKKKEKAEKKAAEAMMAAEPDAAETPAAGPAATPTKAVDEVKSPELETVPSADSFSTPKKAPPPAPAATPAATTPKAATPANDASGGAEEATPAPAMPATPGEPAKTPPPEPAAETPAPAPPAPAPAAAVAAAEDAKNVAVKKKKSKCIIS